MYWEWRKIVTEYMSRMDNFLTFYYYTGNDRFYEEEMASFNVPAKPKSSRLPKGELLAMDVSRRASFPVRGSLSIRATFHAKPVYIPPCASANSLQKIIS